MRGDGQIHNGESSAGQRFLNIRLCARSRSLVADELGPRTPRTRFSPSFCNTSPSHPHHPTTSAHSRASPHPQTACGWEFRIHAVKPRSRINAELPTRKCEKVGVAHQCSAVPSGLMVRLTVPGVKTPGYSHPSLRDSATSCCGHTMDEQEGRRAGNVIAQGQRGVIKCGMQAKPKERRHSCRCNHSAKRPIRKPRRFREPHGTDWTLRVVGDSDRNVAAPCRCRDSFNSTFNHTRVSESRTK